jgi:tetratricopeptide (TPR) repeat protein
MVLRHYKSILGGIVGEGFSFSADLRQNVQKLGDHDPRVAHSAFITLLQTARADPQLSWLLMLAYLEHPLSVRSLRIAETLNSIPLSVFRQYLERSSPLAEDPHYQLLLSELRESQNQAVIDTFGNLDRLFMGVWALFYRKYSQAESHFQRWLTDTPLNLPHTNEPHPFYPHVLLMLAGVYRFQYAYQRALDVLNRMDRLIPGNSIVWTRIGQIHQDMKMHEAATAAFTRAIQLDESNLEPYLLLIWIALDQKDYDKATRYLENAEKIDPDDPFLLCTKADIIALQNRQDDAIPIYKHVLALNPFHFLSRKNLVVSLMELQRYDEAEAEIPKLIELDPDRVEGWLTWGWVKADRGEYQEAITKLQQALLRDPNNVEIMSDLADVYERLGETGRQIRYLQQAIQITPKNGDLYFKLGIVYGRQELWGKAKKILEDGLKYEPTNVQCMNALAELLEGDENTIPQWKNLYEKAIALDSTTKSLLNYGRALYEIEEFENAEKIFQDAWNRSNSDFETALFLGMIAWHANEDKNAANKWFSTAWSLDPGNFRTALEYIDYLQEDPKNTPKILEILDQLEEKHPQDPDIGEYIQMIKENLAHS